jgi:hypothetical protein
MSETKLVNLLAVLFVVCAFTQSCCPAEWQPTLTNGLLGAQTVPLRAATIRLKSHTHCRYRICLVCCLLYVGAVAIAPGHHQGRPLFARPETRQQPLWNTSWCWGKARHKHHQHMPALCIL